VSSQEKGFGFENFFSFPLRDGTTHPISQIKYGKRRLRCQREKRASVPRHSTDSRIGGMSRISYSEEQPVIMSDVSEIYRFYYLKLIVTIRSARSYIHKTVIADNTSHFHFLHNKCDCLPTKTRRVNPGAYRRPCAT